MKQFVLTIDNFYAAVEAEFNPRLAEIPFAVSNGVVVVGVSPEVKLRYPNVAPGMPEALAREKNPQILIVRGDIARYIDYSRVIALSLENLAFRVMEAKPGSYNLDIGGCPLARCQPESAAEMVGGKIRGKIFRAGRAVKLPLAKIAALTAEKNTVRDVPPGTEAGFIESLPPTILPALQTRGELFREMGIRKMGELRQIPLPVLKQLFGGEAVKIHRWAAGDFDDLPQRTSRISREARLSEYTPSPEADINGAIAEMTSELLEGGLKAGSMLLSLTYSDKVTISRRLKLSPTCDEVNLRQAALFILSQIWKRRTRLEYIRLDLAVEPDNGQVSFLEDSRRLRIAHSVNIVRKTYGRTALQYAMAME